MEKKTKRKTKTERFLCQSEIIGIYGFSREDIEKFFPQPILKKNYGYKYPMKLWSESTVASVLKKPSVQKVLVKRRKKLERKNEKENEVTSLLSSYSLSNLMEKSRKLTRKFVLHVGPTNSGKTYNAVKKLEASECGIYLGPLRLLALEMFDRINDDGIPCNLVTGEEQDLVPGAKITASTIEMCDYSKEYDVAVIDEAQMISDTQRGAHWTEALLLVNAKEVHVCMSPVALNVISNLLEKTGIVPEIRTYERLVPLVFKGRMQKLEDVQKGDAIVTFSRKSVLGYVAYLEKLHIRTSVIYGSLPPASRREEVRKFTSGKYDVMVATDAIGMGVSMPIKRIIFAETEKFDGIELRKLHPEEIKQIAGRAGRYRMYDVGEVLSLGNTAIIRNALENPSEPIEYVCIPFPKSVLDTDYDLLDSMKIWGTLPQEDIARREDMSDAIFLYRELGSLRKDLDRRTLFELITCPVDVKNDDLVNYWLQCCCRVVKGGDLPKPNFNTKTLDGCELQYRAYDIYSQISRRTGCFVSCLAEKEEICRKIAKILSEDKTKYQQTCRRCGKPLPPGYRFGICEKCHDDFDYFDYHR